MPTFVTASTFCASRDTRVSYIYCGEPDSIDHTFLEWQCTKSITQDVLQWFNVENNCNFKLNNEDFPFDLSSVLIVATKKLNYTLLALPTLLYL